MTDEGRVLTPMERDWPTIVAWTRHQPVSTDALIEEMSLALDLLRERQTMTAPAEVIAGVTFYGPVGTGNPDIFVGEYIAGRVLTALAEAGYEIAPASTPSPDAQ